MAMGWNIDVQGTQLLRERQCALEIEAQYVNVWGNVHWEVVYSVGQCTLGVQIFFNY